MLNWRSKGSEVEDKEKFAGVEFKLNLALREKEYFPGDTVYGAAFVYIARPESFPDENPSAKKGRFGTTQVTSISVLCTGKQYIRLGIRERSSTFYHQQIILFPPNEKLPIPVDPTSSSNTKNGALSSDLPEEQVTDLESSTKAMRKSMESKAERKSCLELQKDGSYIYPFRWSLPEQLPWTDALNTPPSVDINAVCRYFVTLILEFSNGKRYKSLRSFFVVRPLPIPLLRWEGRCNPETLEMPAEEEIDSEEDPEEAEAAEKLKIPLSTAIHFSDSGRRRSSISKKRKSSIDVGKHENMQLGVDSNTPAFPESPDVVKLAGGVGYSADRDVVKQSQENVISTSNSHSPMFKNRASKDNTSSTITPANDALEMVSFSLPASLPSGAESTEKKILEGSRKPSILKSSASISQNPEDESYEKRRRRRKKRAHVPSDASDDDKDEESKKSNDGSPVNYSRLSQAFVRKGSRVSLFFSSDANDGESSQSDQPLVGAHRRRPSGMRHRPIDADENGEDVQMDVLPTSSRGDALERKPSHNLLVRSSRSRFLSGDDLNKSQTGADSVSENQVVNDKKGEPQRTKSVDKSDQSTTKRTDEAGTAPSPSNQSGQQVDVVPSPRSDEHRPGRHRRKKSSLNKSQAEGETKIEEEVDDMQSVRSFDASAACPRFCRADGSGSAPPSEAASPRMSNKKDSTHTSNSDDTECGLEMIYSISIRSSFIKKASANVPIRLSSVVLVPGQHLNVDLILDAQKDSQLSHVSKIKANLSVRCSFRTPAKEKFSLPLSADTTGKIDWKSKSDLSKRLSLKLPVPMHAPLSILSDHWKVRAEVVLSFVAASVLKDFVSTITVPVVFVSGVIGRNVDSHSRRLQLWTNNFMHLGMHAKDVKKAGKHGDPFIGIQPLLYQGQRRVRNGDPRILEMYIEASISPQPLVNDPSKGGTSINPMLGGIGRGTSTAASQNQSVTDLLAEKSDTSLGQKSAKQAGGMGGPRTYEGSDDESSDSDEEEDLLKYDILIRTVGDDDPSIVTFLPNNLDTNLAIDYKMGMPLPDSAPNPLS